MKIQLPPELTWDVWRAVRAGYATLDEIYSKWSLIDLLEANIVISAVEDAERRAQEKRC